MKIQDSEIECDKPPDPEYDIEQGFP